MKRRAIMMIPLPPMMEVAQSMMSAAFAEVMALHWALAIAKELCQMKDMIALVSA
jgi:hypothetical protein